MLGLPVGLLLGAVAAGCAATSRLRDSVTERAAQCARLRLRDRTALPSATFEQNQKRGKRMQIQWGVNHTTHRSDPQRGVISPDGVSEDRCFLDRRRVPPGREKVIGLLA